MKEYKVSYNLGNMLHSFIIEAETEHAAIIKCLNRIPETSKEIFKNFKIEKHYQDWN